MKSVLLLTVLPIMSLQGSDASDVTLKEYFESRLASQEATFQARIASTQIAIDKAEQALTIRLSSMNELRNSMSDQATKFATISVLDVKTEAIDTRLKSLENDRSNLEGRMWAVGVGAVFVNLVISIGAILVSRRVDTGTSHPPRDR